jgi:hypothetical protein
MHEALQPPKLERNPVTPPKALSLEAADKPMRKKGERVEFGEDLIKAVNFLNAKTELESRIKNLQDLIDLSDEPEARASMEKEIAELEDNRQGILEQLGELRPEEYATEAAFENMLKDKAPAEKRKAIERKEKERDDFEDASRKLKGQLRLLAEEHKHMIGKDVARSHELEAEMREAQTKLDASETNRLEAWRTLAELDPKQFGADAELELSLAQQQKANLTEATEEEAEDVLSALREQIGK